MSMQGSSVEIRVRGAPKIGLARVSNDQVTLVIVITSSQSASIRNTEFHKDSTLDSQRKT